MILRLASFLFLLGTSVATAQEIDVLSGEHGDFTRIVVMARAGQDWALSPQENGYALRLGGGAADFRFGTVFDRIPKTRLLALRQEQGASVLQIETGAGVVADAFELANGPIVIDFRTGPEPDAETVPSGPERVVSSSPFSPAPSPAPPPATRTPIALPQQYLAEFWKSSRPPPAEAPAAPKLTAPLPSTFARPDGRIAEAEQSLLEQLGRAASQGLIRVDSSIELIPEPGPHAPVSATGADASELPAAPAQEKRLAAHLAVRSMTSIDRELLTFLDDQAPLGGGRQCPADFDFDVASWVDETPATLQIGAARRDLLGEFDIASPDAVLRLARVFLAFGFGVEARALIRTFEIDPDQAFPLLLMISVLEDGEGVAHEDLSSLTACNGPAALWGLVASSGPVSGKVNLAAIQRSFSGLPAQMRGFVGPKLVDRLIEIGAIDVAKSVRGALERSQPDAVAPLEMMRARLDLAEGNGAGAETHLRPLISEDGGFSPEALVLLIEEKVAQKQPVEARLTENAGALAFELADLAAAEPLKRAHALGLGSVGAFDQAFEQLAQMADTGEAGLRAKTVQDLFEMIARLDLEPVFLQAYFTHRGETLGAPLDTELRFALADRLVSAGFPETARGVLEDAAFRTERGRLLLARSALAARDAPAALSHLGRADTPEARLMRAQAQMMLGEYGAARAGFEQAGLPDAALDAAWRAGDWGAVGANGTDAQRGFLETFELLETGEASPETAPETAPDAGAGGGEPEGLLTRSRQLIEKSAAERAALERLLQSLEAAPSGS
ncbi:MAG: hypothetical protein R3D78_12460 [Paracoccaceae bacterium]